MSKVIPSVRSGEEQISLPTYLAYAADPNPMFLEKRVYQGSSGKVYPNPFTDRISTEKSDRSYRSIYLENEYVRLTILPELGGRIFTGQDKTNGYDFFYRQNVIKPALVGLLGPWISGGVEFNWPQHHRPSTFMPVHASIEHGEDGSATVWLSEHDPMLRMKGMVGICLHPGRSVVEAKVRLYNRTPFVQTFLWWANVAVHANDRYQAFFPPDVEYVADHAKRAVSHFPIAKNFYYGVDYTDGVDLRWYKNIPVPTSYMVTQSNYDFAGGYDHSKQAGFVHVADRHIAPGKKLWTWGNGDFGKAWDRNLTDSDGPYIELMAGVYTDNQPDFSWIHPYETKSFSQFWYPIQKIGPVCCANVHAAMSLERTSNNVRLGVCASEYIPVCSIKALLGKEEILSATTDLAPGAPWIQTFSYSGELDELRFELRNTSDELVLVYQSENTSLSKLPEPATEPLPPAQMESADELYITGLHLEQYRHATRSPESYWEEGLRRDPGDARINNALGLLALKRGEFARAEDLFCASIARLTLRNPNPLDGEPYYNLGLSLLYQGQANKAYAAFYKATWNHSWRSAASFELAKICCQRNNFAESLQHLEVCLKTDTENLKARDLQAAVLRRIGQKDRAEMLLDETLRRDPLDFLALAERTLLTSSRFDDAIHALAGDVQTALDIAFDYAGAGLLDEALAWLKALDACTEAKYPIVLYTLAWLADLLCDEGAAKEYRQRAASAPSLYCFPARLEEMVVLQEALRRDLADAKASYYLGNFYYDRRRYDQGMACWRDSVAVDPKFSITWRNLGIAEFNVRQDTSAALSAYAKACEVNPDDARLLYEFDQLKKRVNVDPALRLSSLEKRSDLVELRDDLTIETITLLNLTGQHDRALGLLSNRRFNPWEGGEGLVSGQYVETHLALGQAAFEVGDFLRAADHIQRARKYPENLGEGKHLLTLERQLDYWEGLALEHAGDTRHADKCYRDAAAPLEGYSVHNFYRALALRKLRRKNEAQNALEELYAYVQRRREVEPKIDYFATSLPNFLLFEDDLSKRDQVDCLVLEAYAELGCERPERALELFLEAATLDASNLRATQEISQLMGTTATPERTSV
jgi:tetratricopeptide (TPR) repeat protein